MKEFHGEYKGEALATVNSTNTAGGCRRLRLSSSFRNSDDACAYGGGNLRGGFCYP